MTDVVGSSSGATKGNRKGDTLLKGTSSFSTESKIKQATPPVPKRKPATSAQSSPALLEAAPCGSRIGRAASSSSSQQDANATACRPAAPTSGTSSKPPLKPQGKAAVRQQRKCKRDPEALQASLLPIPHGLLCPICRDVFSDPVATEDGHSYCKSCIQQWFKAYDDRLSEFYFEKSNIAPFSRKMPPSLLAPMTSLQLSSKSLMPNIALRQAAEEYKKTRPIALQREHEYQDLKRSLHELQDEQTELVALRSRVAELEELLSRTKVELKKAITEHDTAELQAAVEEVSKPCSSDEAAVDPASPHPEALEFEKAALVSSGQVAARAQDAGSGKKQKNKKRKDKREAPELQRSSSASPFLDFQEVMQLALAKLDFTQGWHSQTTTQPA
eukprot:TRINITY_DN27530_c0_g1_i1.p1 TRINITY_DN27530_c0_g1~~TRINITY_DN27530_c0_g1_i1.p1  ORF type:complete len:387 (-),score=92.75 TRINITY_DN27530_c0_g1_i1:170-1330(-)